mgnify:FL=1|jgi:hypothetical protein
MCYNGQGGNVDLFVARFYLGLSANQGNQRAQQILDGMNES